MGFLENQKKEVCMLKKIAAGFLLLSSSLLAQDVFITVDQFGYRPGDSKVAVLRDPVEGYDSLLSYTPGNTINLVDSATLEVVYSAAPVAFNSSAMDTASGDKIWWFDFSSVSTPGTYFVQDALDTSKKSFNFRIQEDIYNDILKAALRVLYYQRVGMAKEAAYAGEEWADGMNHAQDAKARYFLDSTNAALERDVSGGWFDAGDYNKYTDWNGNYIETLLMAFLERPKAFTDDYGIPESGNGIPDILDEVKWGVDHLLRLQNEDGSVISVVGEHQVSPPSAATGRTYYGAPNATATYSAAKAFAISAYVAKLLGKQEDYERLLDAAKRGFTWAENHQDSLFYNNSAAHGTSGLAAGQQEIDPSGDDVTCSRLQNRVESSFRLYQVTEDSTYLQTFEENYKEFPLMNGWGDQYRYDQHNMFLLYCSFKHAKQEIKAEIEERLVKLMNKPADFMGAINVDGYRSFIRDYNWGSNSAKSSYGVLYARLAQSGFSGIDPEIYTSASKDYLHYIHGVNPFGHVYMTNMSRYGAEKSLTRIYHKWFDVGTKWDYVGEGKFGPAPGYVSGGPNSRYLWDNCCSEYDANNSAKGCGSVSNNQKCYATERPIAEPSAKMYKDINAGWPINSWELTEPSLGYQTKYIHLISRFVEERGKDISELTTPIKSSVNKPVSLFAKFVGNKLEIASETSVRSVRIFDVNNKEVMRFNENRGTLSLDVSSLRAGVYGIRVSTDKNTITKILAKY